MQKKKPLGVTHHLFCVSYSRDSVARRRQLLAKTATRHHTERLVTWQLFFSFLFFSRLSWRQTLCVWGWVGGWPIWQRCLAPDLSSFQAPIRGAGRLITTTTMIIVTVMHLMSGKLVAAAAAEEEKGRKKTCSAPAHAQPMLGITAPTDTPALISDGGRNLAPGCSVGVLCILFFPALEL